MTTLNPDSLTADDLKRARIDAGLSQDKLAALLGIEQSAVSRIERNGNPQLATLTKWAAACGCRVVLRPAK